MAGAEPGRLPLARASSTAAGCISDLVLANQILAQRGILDAFGHVSVRHPEAEDRFLLARSMAPALVSGEDIASFGLDGQPISPDTPKPYIERFIHSEIYRARPDAVAIVHSHATAVIPFSVTPTPLQPIFHMSAFLLEPVPVFDTRDHKGDSDLLIRDQQSGRALAATMGAHCAALQRGHGFTVIGQTLREAVFRAVYLTVNAQLQANAQQLGTVTFLSHEEARLASAAVRAQIDRAWQLWLRDLGLADS